MASNTSAKVKNRWNGEHYDIIRFAIPKGTKVDLQMAADSREIALSQLIRDAIVNYLDWSEWPEPKRDD